MQDLEDRHPGSEFGGSSYQAVSGWEQLPAGLTHRDVADVAVDSQDRVFVLARMDPRVIVYDSSGRFVDSWGEGHLSERPHGITIGPDEVVYCVDELDHQVRKFDLDGRPLGTIGSGVPSDTGYVSEGDITIRQATIGRSAGPFNRPTKLAVAPSGDLYISDGYGNARIHRYSAEGELKQSWGRPGTGPGEFHLPHSVCATDGGRILVCDRENDRIQVFSLDGEFIEIWSDVQRPTAVVGSPDGSLLVAELPRPVGHYSWIHGAAVADLPGRISVLDGEGRVVDRFGAGGAGASGTVSAPHGIAVDSRGDLYVAEVIHTFWGEHASDCSPTLQKFSVRR